MDVILITMVIGITIVNLSPRRSQELIQQLKGLSTPIYVLFFVLVGARLGITAMPGWLWLIILFYIVGRTVGKVAGSWIGAKITHAPDVVRKYNGLALFAQGGVAIGLSIMASQHLNAIPIKNDLFLGDVIIFGITATTFIVQIIGPPLVKLAIRLSGEINKNLTEEDIITEWKIADIMNKNFITVSVSAPLRTIFTSFQNTELSFLPVIDEKKQLTGIITIDQIKDVILDESVWDWLVASDIMAQAPEMIQENQPLPEAIKLMNQTFIEQIPVASRTESSVLVGILDRQLIKRAVNKKIVALGTAQA